jgi:hypothetical protein
MTLGVYREIAIETKLVAQILMVMLQSIGRDRETPRPDAEPRVKWHFAGASHRRLVEGTDDKRAAAECFGAVRDRAP